MRDNKYGVKRVRGAEARMDGIIGDSLRNSVLKICRDPGIHGDYGCGCHAEQRGPEGRENRCVTVNTK